MDINILWENFLNKIKDQVSNLSYESWFKDTRLASLSTDTAVIVVPMTIHKKHLSDNYSTVISDIFNILTGSNFNFVYKLEDELESDTIVEDIEIGIPSFSPMEANLNPNYTFENFVIGETNKFAYTASLSVAEKPGKSYNPLFLYGKSGLGKTHLMHAIGNYIIKNSNKRVLYITSDKFVSDFISTVRNKSSDSLDDINSFKNKYRSVDVLIVDDIQFLEGATATQQEFFHVFNELHNSNKQIIIASDRAVNDLKSIENRLTTRFAWGLTANIFPPDLELRTSIIRSKIKYQESLEDVPEDVIQYIANSFDSDVRQLEGAITRVFAYSLMMGDGKISLEIATEALKDQVMTKSIFKNDVHRIQRIVSDYFKISVDDLKGKKRTKNIAFPRQIAIYLCRDLTNESFPRIGTYFGSRDHSTIMHSVEKIDKELTNNGQIREIIKDIKKLILS